MGFIEIALFSETKVERSHSPQLLWTWIKYWTVWVRFELSTFSWGVRNIHIQVDQKAVHELPIPPIWPLFLGSNVQRWTRVFGERRLPSPFRFSPFLALHVTVALPFGWQAALSGGTIRAWLQELFHRNTQASDRSSLESFWCISQIWAEANLNTKGSDIKCKFLRCQNDSMRFSLRKGLHYTSAQVGNRSCPSMNRLVDAMPIRDNFSELGANWIVSLSSFDVHNLWAIRIQHIQKATMRSQDRWIAHQDHGIQW
jgi:hypothetical protein